MLGHIIIKECHAAKWVGVGNDVQIITIGQMPPFFARFNLPKRLKLCIAPIFKVGLFGHFFQASNLFQNHRHAGLAVQKLSLYAK